MLFNAINMPSNLSLLSSLKELYSLKIYFSFSLKSLLEDKIDIGVGSFVKSKR